MDKKSIYFRNGKLVSKSGDVRIYRMDNELFMEDGRLNLVSSDQKLSDYIWQIGNKPFGDCLVIGLGLGTVARYLLSLTKVNSVMVLEENKDIIVANSNINKSPDLYKIVYSEYIPFLYRTTKKFDFIFIDCYSKVDEFTLPYIADSVAACKKVLKSNGILLGWLDNNTPERFIEAFYSLFDLD